MRWPITLLLSFFLASCLGENKMKSLVLEQADQFGNDLRKRNYDMHLDKMAHFVYANKDERELLKQTLMEASDLSSGRDADMIKVTSILDSEILENDGYYQCLVKQARYYTNTYSTYKNEVTLIAVSKDGENWRFADVTGVSTEVLRGVFPELHEDLKITGRVK